MVSSNFLHRNTVKEKKSSDPFWQLRKQRCTWLVGANFSQCITSRTAWRRPTTTRQTSVQFNYPDGPGSWFVTHTHTLERIDTHSIRIWLGPVWWLERSSLVDHLKRWPSCLDGCEGQPCLTVWWSRACLVFGIGRSWVVCKISKANLSNFFEEFETGNTVPQVANFLNCSIVVTKIKFSDASLSDLHIFIKRIQEFNIKTLHVWQVSAASSTEVVLFSKKS